MNNSQKMILVPVEKYDRMVKQMTADQELPSVQTAGDEFTRIDAQMHKVLNSSDSKNEREKAIEFSQLLQKYLMQKGVLNNFPDKRDVSIDEYNETIDASQRPDIESLVKLLPKTYKNAARALLGYLLESGSVSWNSKNQLIHKSKTYENINIFDVLNDCVKRKKPEARGLHFFLSVLNQINTPLALISNPAVRDRINQSPLSFSRSSVGPSRTSTPNSKDSLRFSLSDDSTIVERNSWSKL